jgi:hypothetical protein
MTQQLSNPPRARKMARPPAGSTEASAITSPVAAVAAPKAPSRLDQLQDLLLRTGGASIAEMVGATGWQQHSVRGAMAGTLKKRGLTIASEKADGVRRYHASAPA